VLAEDTPGAGAPAVGLAVERERDLLARWRAAD
jgi:hypothetical protein